MRRRSRRRLAALALAFALGSGAVACGSAEPSPTPTPNDGLPNPEGSAEIEIPPPPLDVAGAAQLRGPWSSIPFRANPAIVAAADRECRNALRPFPPTVQFVLSDARGASVLQLWYAGPNGDQASCYDLTIGANGAIEALGGGGTTTGLPQPPPPLGHNDIRINDNSGSGDPMVAAYLAGQIGPDIVAVRVDRPGRPPVWATVANGWFGAWMPAAWPNGSKVVGLDAAGDAVAELPL